MSFILCEQISILIDRSTSLFCFLLSLVVPPRPFPVCLPSLPERPPRHPQHPRLLTYLLSCMQASQDQHNPSLGMTKGDGGREVSRGWGYGFPTYDPTPPAIADLGQPNLIWLGLSTRLKITRANRSDVCFRCRSYWLLL